MDTKEFLKEHAVYQIYPISFKDSNGDGCGDLQGIISKLDYLKEIGIKIIWLSPIYESPMVDFGYDISNYEKINPLFGTMKDFNELMEEATARGIKIVMDLVVNHTSDQHKWFKEAIKVKTSPYRDYYIFKQGKRDEKGNLLPPNNWTSNFTGSAWEPVEGEENMYYLHIFTKQQPDLNWHNPKVLEEVKKIICFWMDKGVYGFRCDVISEIYKASFEDGKVRTEPGNPIGMEHYLAKEGNHNILKIIQRDVIEPRGGVLIGECGGNITTEDGKKFLDKELDTFFQFETANTYRSQLSKHIDPKKLKKTLIHWQEEVDWNGNYFENHDQRRVFDKYVWGKYEKYGSMMILTLLFTLRGTPFIYMGQEFGMHNYQKALPLSQCKDIVTQNVYQMVKRMHIPSFMALKLAHKYGRDDARIPLSFTKEETRGFSTTKPWQPYNSSFVEYNAEDQASPKGILSYFKKINELRESRKVLSYGTIDFKMFDDGQKDVLCYLRSYEGESMFIVINLTNKKRNLPQKIKEQNEWRLVLCNYDHVASYLRPYEAIVYDCGRLSLKR